jgi:hypothetical protein
MARDQAGNLTVDVQELEFETPPLPADFPPIRTLLSTPKKMEPGVTLFAPMKWPTGGEQDEHYGIALAVDAAGEVVWYYRGEESVGDPRPLPNGNLLCMIGHNRAFEMDMLGNVVGQWHASQHQNPVAAG